VKKVVHSALLLLLVAGIFLAGSWYGQRGDAKSSIPGARKILHYVDPMHPAYTSDKPGIAADCGMELVPVYEDGGMGGTGGAAGMPPGRVNVLPEKQQLLGVRVHPVEKASATQTLRILGRVAPDETRTYKINAGIEGFIREVSAVTTGSQVKKDQQLATFSAPNSIQIIQQYILVLGAVDRVKQAITERSVEAQAAPLANSNYQQRVNQLQNLGMSVLQMEEIERTRQVPESITIVAPSDGVVLARNVSPGLKFDRGTEWYRIADLRQVWILADVSLKEAQYLRPGMRAQVTLPELEVTLPARVAEVQPQFDETTRTLKVRLVADNPGSVLRPGMFVDVGVPVTRPPAIVVPADAVVDSGAKKTVYVAKGDGVFEPRKVETGWRAGDQVEIVKGLMAGERIVVSGTFLIDSESRMKAAGGATGHMHAGHSHMDEGTPAGRTGKAASAPALTSDPVCGMDVDQAKAEAAGRTAEYNGQTYVFCSDECQGNFAKEPTKYSRKVGKDPTTLAGKRLSEVQWEGGKAAEKESGHVGHMRSSAVSVGSPGHQHP
jgi:RND family efflux transporter MFP subunit